MKPRKLGKNQQHLMDFLTKHTDILHTAFHFANDAATRRAVQGLVNRGLVVADIPSSRVQLQKDNWLHRRNPLKLEAFKQMFRVYRETGLPNFYRDDFLKIDRETLRNDKEGEYNEFIWIIRPNGTRLISVVCGQISDFGHAEIKHDILNNTDGRRFYHYRDGQLKEIFFQVTDTKRQETNKGLVLESLNIRRY